MTALIEAGYNLNAKNEQNQTLEASVTKRVNANKYPGSKDGKLAKVRDQQILNLLKPKVESEDERKKNMQNRLIIGVIIAAAVVAVIQQVFIDKFHDEFGCHIDGILRFERYVINHFGG